MDRQILRKWLKAGFMDKGILYATGSGTPQGSPISPVLSNMCLDGLEQKLTEQSGQKNTAPARRHKVNYVRFADDFICTGSSRELLEEKVKPLITQFMAERGLTLSEEKNIITHIDNGFDFLGRNIRKYNGKLLIKPSKKNLKNHLDKVRTIIEKNQMVTAAQLIIMLNPVIRGWANYHRNITILTIKYGEKSGSGVNGATIIKDQNGSIENILDIPELVHIGGYSAEKIGAAKYGNSC